MKKRTFEINDYTLFSSVFLLLHQPVDAEVFYTDIDPDITLQFDNENTGIDMDNNGSIDFVFLNSSSIYTTFWTSSSNTFTFEKNEIFVGPYRYENEVACPYFTFSGYIWYRPYAITYGALIGESLRFSNYDYQLMARGAWGIENPGGAWWPVIEDHYLGVYFSDSDYNMHYGWIRCSVDSAEIITIKDYAYEVNPDVGIIAGDTIGDTTTAIVEINTLDANVYSFGKTIFIHFVKIDSKTTIQVYDLAGNELLKKIVESKYSEINMNEFPAGIYLLSIKQGTNIYTKKISIQ